MPEVLLLRYADEMSRIRAIRVLDAAQASLYGQLVKTKEGGKQWVQRWTQQALSTRKRVSNNIREVRAWLRQVLGSGYSE